MGVDGCATFLCCLALSFLASAEVLLFGVFHLEGLCLLVLWAPCGAGLCPRRGRQLHRLSEPDRDVSWASSSISALRVLRCSASSVLRGRGLLELRHSSHSRAFSTLPVRREICGATVFNCSQIQDKSRASWNFCSVVSSSVALFAVHVDHGPGGYAGYRYRGSDTAGNNSYPKHLIEFCEFSMGLGVHACSTSMGHGSLYFCDSRSSCEHSDGYSAKTNLSDSWKLLRNPAARESATNPDPTVFWNVEPCLAFVQRHANHYRINSVRPKSVSVIKNSSCICNRTLVIKILESASVIGN